MQGLKCSTLFNKLKAKIMQILCTGVSKNLIASQQGTKCLHYERQTDLGSCDRAS